MIPDRYSHSCLLEHLLSHIDKILANVSQCVREPIPEPESFERNIHLRCHTAISLRHNMRPEGISLPDASHRGTRES